MELETARNVRPDLVLLNEVPKVNSGTAASDWSSEVARLLGWLTLMSARCRRRITARPAGVTRAGGSGESTSRYSAGGASATLTSTSWPVGAGRRRAQYALASTSVRPRGSVLLAHPHSARWAKSKHETLARTVLAEEPLGNIIVGGDFNVPTDSPVLARLSQSAALTNAIGDAGVDHILYRSVHRVVVTAAGLDMAAAGPSSARRLSDHPIAWARLQMAI